MEKSREANKGWNTYILGILVAVELFMSFSFLGYIHVEPISVTLVYLPVLAAGFLLGKWEAVLVAAFFGLSSMWKASVFYASPGDAYFSLFMSGKPAESILLSLGARMLFGLTVGILYQMARKSAHPLAAALVVTSVGRTIHAFFVYGFLEMLFPESGFTVAHVLTDIKRWDFPVFVLFADGLILLFHFLRQTQYVRRLIYRTEMVEQMKSSGKKGNKLALLAAVAGVLLAAFSVAFYFINRMGTLLLRHGINLPQTMIYDLMNLQIQFLTGLISLAMLVMIVVVLHQKNFTYLYDKARKDGLTDLMGRHMFFQSGELLLKHMSFDQPDQAGCFVVLDVDSFKAINDQYGHPEGDQVLLQVADCLRNVFYDKGIIGRLGGDEFIVLMNRPMTRPETKKLLDDLRSQLSQIRIHQEPVTCSIGVIPVEKNCRMEDLYRSADQLLYEAKKKGKDQFVLGRRKGSCREN